MCAAWVPDEIVLEHPAVPLTHDLSRVTFYVPQYMGAPDTLEVMAHMPELRVVQLLTAGYDNALAYVPSAVTLCNAAGVHDSSTAELAVGMMISAQRGLDDFARANGTWLHARRPALADSRVLIVGAGGVGRAIAQRLVPFEVEVRMVGRRERTGVHGVGDLAELLPWADIVILAVPLDAHTRGMVDAQFLARMHSGALLVNVSRGAVVQTDALLGEAGRIRAALDVTDPEPLPSDHPLWSMPGVLITPHVGGNTSAYLPRATRLVAEQLERFAQNLPLRNVVRSAQ